MQCVGKREWGSKPALSGQGGLEGPVSSISVRAVGDTSKQVWLFPLHTSTLVFPDPPKGSGPDRIQECGGAHRCVGSDSR